MLLQFNVTNALSFKREAILDLVANADNAHAENLIKEGKNKVIPTAAIYGANAAGKSNLFKALDDAIMFVRTSERKQVNELINIFPFMMDDEGRLGKTRFDFLFTYEGIKYEYGFVIDITRVYEEYLYEYKTAKPSMIFERESTNKYRYPSALRKTMKPYEEKNTDNKLFLSTATAWNCKMTEKPFRWFVEMIDVYDGDSVRREMASALNADNKGEIREFARKYLKAADFNISDYTFSMRTVKPLYVEEMPIDENELEIPSLLKEWKLTMSHTVEVDGKTQNVEIPFSRESGGTQLFFSYLPAVYKALKNGKTIVIDEIDNGLHPLLVRNLVELFNNHETNPNGAQLIFNTHDVGMLDLDMFRRDQIYFVEKDNRTGESELYSLSDFSPRKNDKIRKGYMLGRYGAVPNIGGMEW